jgi:LuxR family transcriptional regulator of csgAB operon
MLAGCWINIIGPHTLQNTLLAEYIQQETAAEYEVIDSCKHPVKLRVTRKPTLTLIDSHGDEVEQALITLTECRKRGQVDQLIAFYNALPRGRLETLVSPPDVQGIFYLSQSKETLIKGVIQIFSGELWLPRRLLNRLVLKDCLTTPPLKISSEHDILTTRELQILNLLSTGAKNSEIAHKMCLSIHTIKTHIYHIYKKIEVENRTQAVRWASQNLS